MSLSLKQLIQGLPTRVPPADLFDRISAAIEKEALLKKLWRRAIAYSVGFLVLGGTLVVFRSYFWTELAQSSFSSYLQVIFSDYDRVLIYWKEMLLSLLESLPIVNLMAWSLLLFFAISLVSKLSQIWSQFPRHHNNQLQIK